MMVLCVRTDKPEAELYLHDGSKVIAKHVWLAHRQLAETLHSNIRDILLQAGCTMNDLTGVITYQGPGSFTGLRIGLSVTNAMAYSLVIDAVGSTGDTWIEKGMVAISNHLGPQVIMPEYGAEANITQPKK